MPQRGLPTCDNKGQLFLWAFGPQSQWKVICWKISSFMWFPHGSQLLLAAHCSKAFKALSSNRYAPKNTTPAIYRHCWAATDLSKLQECWLQCNSHRPHTHWTFPSWPAIGPMVHSFMSITALANGSKTTTRMCQIVWPLLHNKS